MEIRWRIERRRVDSDGQVIVEVLLVLPIFLLLVFSIMEIGHLAFRTILIHHAAYEVARYGALTNKNKAGIGCQQPSVETVALKNVGRQILPTAECTTTMTQTLSDPQELCPNYDLVVTCVQTVPMIFPMTGLIFATKGSKGRRLAASVPMPVERPLFR